MSIQSDAKLLAKYKRQLKTLPRGSIKRKIVVTEIHRLTEKHEKAGTWRELCVD